MEQFEIAHIREQGVDLIIVPLDTEFGDQEPEAQQATMVMLQEAAKVAGLAGTVVPVWRVGNSHNFIAPKMWHPFFASLPYSRVIASLNKVLTLTDDAA
jgi:hypothetical protein